MKKNNNYPRQGEIWIFQGLESDLQETKEGNLTLVISNNLRNEMDASIVVLPLTRALENSFTGFLLKENSENGLSREEMVLCDFPLTLSTKQFTSKVGYIENQLLEEIKHKLMKTVF